MNAREVRREIARLNSLGLASSAIFARLSGQGVSESRLARLVAAHVDARRHAGNLWHIRIVILIALAQAARGSVQAFGAGEQIMPGTGLLIGGVELVFGLPFAWGFYRNQVSAYNAWLLMAIVQLPFDLDGLAAAPAATVLALLTGPGLAVYVWWVRARVFPDFVFLSPRKVGGSYVFSD